MTWQQWVVFALTVAGALTPVVVYVRKVEKRIDQHDHTLYGEQGDNGHKLRIVNLERWREDHRAALPEMLRKATHDAKNQIAPQFNDLDQRIEGLEERVRDLEMKRRGR